MTPFRAKAAAALLATTTLVAPGLAWAQSGGTAGGSQPGVSVPRSPSGPEQQAPVASPPQSDPTGQAQADPTAPTTLEDVITGDESDVAEVVVTGRFVPNERRLTSQVADVVTTEDLARTGDSEIAGALQRVPGLSLVGDGFVYVRGLGERYSSALLDGSSLPSPEPLRRVVPLDIFPTNLLSGALVQKTYSVEFPGEFGGGVISLRTRTTPQAPFLEMSTGVGYNTESTGEDNLRYNAGRLTFLGFDRGALDFPEILRRNPSLQGYTNTQLIAAGQSLRDEFTPEVGDNAVDVGFNINAGTAFDIGTMRLGLLGAVNYDSEQRNIDGVRNTFAISNAGLVPQDQLSPEGCAGVPGIEANSCGLFRSDWDIRLDFIGSAGLEIDENNAIRYTTLLLRRVTRQVLNERGRFADDPGLVRDFTRLNYVEQQVYTNQLSGEHERDFGDPILGGFSRAVFNWRASYAFADRDTPYRRDYTYTLEGDGSFRFSTRDQNRTIFSALDDENGEIGGDLRLSGIFADRDVTVRLGGLYNDRQRDFAQRRYSLTLPSGAFIDLRTQRPEVILSDNNIANLGVRLNDFTDLSDSFSANQQIGAAYASLEVQLTERLRITGGARYENSQQEVDTADPGTGNLVNVQLDSEYLLPSITATFEFVDNLQLRGGYSRTLSRPDLRELSNSEFLDEDTDQLERGNPTLGVTEIDNYDARLEWYFATGQSLSIGAFYKDFSRPIERTFSLLGEDPIRSFANAESAELYGAEVELEVNVPLDRLFPGNSFIEQRRFFVIANATVIESEIALTAEQAGQQTSNARRLQGQSDMLGNLQIGYDSRALGERLALLVNYTGDRIRDVGLFGAPDVIEEVPLLLDLVFSKRFTIGEREFDLGFRAENLLGERFELNQGGAINERFDLGTTLSVGVTARF